MTRKEAGTVEFGFFEAGSDEGTIEVVDKETGESVRSFRVIKSEYLKGARPKITENIDTDTPLSDEDS